MILEDIIGLLFSLMSSLTSSTPQLFREERRNDDSEFKEFSETETDTTSEETTQESETFWQNEIHEEYEHTEECLAPNYVSLNDESRVRSSVGQSVLRSLRVNFEIMVAVFPLSLLTIVFIYWELNTKNLCYQWEQNNHSIPLSVLKWKLIGDETEDIVMNLWFPVTLALLFGWMEFKLNYITTLLVGFGVGATVANYKSFLFLFNVYTTKTNMRFIGNSMIFVAIILNTILVARKFSRVHSSTAASSLRVFIIIFLEFIIATAWAWLYAYVVVPAFNDQRDAQYKAIVATFSVVLAPTVPSAIFQYIAMRRSNGIIRPDRSFVQVYFFRGTCVTLYRIMQADFKSIWLFIILSSIHGVSKVFAKVTRKFRQRKWTLLVERLKRTSCFRRLKQRPYNTPHQRRLNADLEVQNTLFEYTALILSQAYLVLYLVTNYEVTFNVWSALKDSVIRIIIGLGIEFLFNCLSVFIEMHCYDVPVRGVWFKCWKFHLTANSIIITAIVFFFTASVLTIYQTRMNDSSEKYNIRNCTLPFTRL